MTARGVYRVESVELQARLCGTFRIRRVLRQGHGQNVPASIGPRDLDDGIACGDCASDAGGAAAALEKAECLDANSSDAVALPQEESRLRTGIHRPEPHIFSGDGFTGWVRTYFLRRRGRHFSDEHRTAGVPRYRKGRKSFPSSSRLTVGRLRACPRGNPKLSVVCP